MMAGEAKGCGVAWSRWARVPVMGIVSGLCACMETQVARGPVDPGDESGTVIVPKEWLPPLCEAGLGDRPADRPVAGEARVEERPERDGLMIRYSATPRDAPCETLDMVFRVRGEMLMGEPKREVELVWTGDREVGEDAQLGLCLGSSTVAQASVLARRGSWVEASTRLPAADLARHGAADRPTFVIADRRIELSNRQTDDLRNFLRRLPFRRPPGPPVGDPELAVREKIAEDPASGRGWFCVEAENVEKLKKRASSCHRTAAECEEARLSMRSKVGQVSQCMPAPAAQCYSWRAGTDSRESCFYRPSQCSRDVMLRSESEAGWEPTSDCHLVR
jgi:hypothetical protein